MISSSSATASGADGSVPCVPVPNLLQGREESRGVRAPFQAESALTSSIQVDTLRRVFTVRLTQEFQDWLDALKDLRAQVRIAARLRLAEAGNLGDWKPLGGEVSEMRVDFGPGYRLYFTRRGSVLIVILAGGDKSTQVRDIKRAQLILKELELEP